MRAIVWRCDGCSASKEQDDNPYTTVRVVVEYVRHHSPAPEAQALNKLTDSLYKGGAVDLCEVCKRKLTKAVNVKDWGKADAAGN